ncbi:MAG: hypothetical protein IPK07_32060 [Deltaproteobacteria bacterium]|nr:hypothetical protein [Deltaproteobacteria bacterium]
MRAPDGATLRAALAAGLWVLAVSPRAAAGGDAARLRAERYFEVVELAGMTVEERAFAFRDGRWTAVPAQPPADGDAALALAESAGELAPAPAPGGLREVRLHDPLSGADGYLYVGRGEAVDAAPSPAAPTPTRYQADARRITAACYAIDFDGEDPALFTALAVEPGCGGSGRNVFAGLDSHSTATLVGVGLDVHTDRGDLVSEVRGVRGGRLAVARTVGYSVKLPLGRTSAETVQTARFYPYHYVFPVRLALPAIVDYVVRRLDIEMSGFWRADAAPFSFTTGDGAHATFDGHPDESESALDGQPFTGWRVASADGVVVNLLALDAAAPFAARLRYRDERTERGGVAALGPVGLVLRATGDVSGREWRATSTTLFPRAGDERSPAEFARILAHPLVVTEMDGAAP